MKITAHKFEHRTRFSDYAILYRGNHQARLIEQQLRNHKIPLPDVRAAELLRERAEIRDVIAYLRLLLNSDDDLAFIRAVTTPARHRAVHHRGAGQLRGQRHLSLFGAAFEEGAAQHLNARQLASYTSSATSSTGSPIVRHASRPRRCSPTCSAPSATRPGCTTRAIRREAESKWSNVSDFVGWLGRKGEEDNKNLLELTQTISPDQHARQGQDDFDGVQMATLHASKGRSSSTSSLVGVEEGHPAPHQSSIDEE